MVAFVRAAVSAVYGFGRSALSYTSARGSQERVDPAPQVALHTGGVEGLRS